jgi:hypothetical protein
MRMPLTPARRMVIIVIIVGALAALLVAADRWRFETRNRSVELSMDQQDLSDFAHAYGYNMDELLREMRRSGLTSVAVYEELGQRINLGTHAIAFAGQQLIDSARTSPLADPMLAAMARTHRLSSDDVYILVYDRPTMQRYASALRIHVEPRNVRVLRARLPAILAVKTQIDFFNSLGLGIPDDVALQVRRMGLLVDPRVQNDERLNPDQIAAVFNQMLQGGRIGSVIFFGQRNEVLGYPYNLDATADTFRATHVNFGNVEAYDPNQIQKGSITLARKIVSQTVRVQAISKIELDKLDLDTVVARYVLGVRERNIRVVYLRPFPHVIQQTQPDGSVITLSAEATNLEMLRQLRDGLAANGFSAGRAAGFVDFKSATLTLLYFLAAVGVVGAFLLLLDIYGWTRSWMPWVFFGVTTLAFLAGVLSKHDVVVRQLWALGGALTFAILAGTTLAAYFRQEATAAGARSDILRGLRCLLQAVGVAVLGGIFIVGLLSQATFMIEVQQAIGTKLLLAAPPLLLLVAYAFTSVFGNPQPPARVVEAPLRVWQFAAVMLLAAGSVVLLARSGNQADVSVSSFESHIRGTLTTLVGARPRFKEFLIGFPALVLLPLLTPAHKRAIGWLIVIAAGIGLADVLDTFSHIHTPLLVTLLRVFNGLLFGAVIGIALQYAYRWLALRKTRARRS